MKIRVNTYKPDVFAIAETHCQQAEDSPKYCPDEALQIEGYIMYRQDNCNERKGGIIVYVSEEIAVTHDKKIDNLCAHFKDLVCGLL